MLLDTYMYHAAALLSSMLRHTGSCGATWKTTCVQVTATIMFVLHCNNGSTVFVASVRGCMISWSCGVYQVIDSMVNVLRHNGREAQHTDNDVLCRQGVLHVLRFP